MTKSDSTDMRKDIAKWNKKGEEADKKKSRVVRAKSHLNDCESTNYRIPASELRNIAHDMIGTPVYDGVDTDKVVGHIIAAYVKDDDIEYEAEIDER